MEQETETINFEFPIYTTGFRTSMGPGDMTKKAKRVSN
jgi:hypothetical protein